MLVVLSEFVVYLLQVLCLGVMMVFEQGIFVVVEVVLSEYICVLYIICYVLLVLVQQVCKGKFDVVLVVLLFNIEGLYLYLLLYYELFIVVLLVFWLEVGRLGLMLSVFNYWLLFWFKCECNSGFFDYMCCIFDWVGYVLMYVEELVEYDVLLVCIVCGEGMILLLVFFFVIQCQGVVFCLVVEGDVMLLSFGVIYLFYQVEFVQ